MIIGVLALQGAFIEHQHILDKLDVQSFQIRNKTDLKKPMNGIILPGGESTAIGKLLNDLEMFDELKKIIALGLPTFGTCAGMILLAKDIENNGVSHFGLMDIKVIRNAYGRQLGSFYTEAKYQDHTIPMTFIRAPYIASHGDTVEILSTVDGKDVAAIEKNMLATAFHPELNDDLTIHKHFLTLVEHHMEERKGIR